MIKADLHTHSSFSGDSDEPMENLINSAISKGIETLCITEHMDLAFPHNDAFPDDKFVVDTNAYMQGFAKVKEAYNGKINLLFGIELGLQPFLSEEHQSYVNRYPFDFIIGSEHTTNKKDPYYPAFYEGRNEYEAYCEYFDDIVTNLNAFSDFQSFGHLDYVVRYGPNKNSEYSYSKYSDYIDTILSLLIDKGIALEANTGGYRYNLGNPNPSADILRRYKEMGGELLTIGSDAHTKDNIAYEFSRVEALLSAIGFRYYTVYKNRQPEFIAF